MHCCAAGQRSREPSDDAERVQSTDVSVASFNSEEGFGSPQMARTGKGRVSVFDMDDNELQVGEAP